MGNNHGLSDLDLDTDKSCKQFLFSLICVSDIIVKTQGDHPFKVHSFQDLLGPVKVTPEHIEK